MDLNHHNPKLKNPRSCERGFYNLVGRDGFEPSTNWLKANCSTAELTALRRGAYHTDQKLKFKRYFDIS
jgi:hypothetical protein